MIFSDTWLQNAWDSLDVKERAFYSVFVSGGTLYEIALEFDTEWLDAETICNTASEVFCEEAQELIEESRLLLSENKVISFQSFCESIGEKPSHASLALIIEAGGRPYLDHLSRLDGRQIYSVDTHAFDDLYVATLAAAPVSISHFAAMVEKGKVLPTQELIEAKGEMIFDSEVGVLRTKAKVRDRSYLYLQEKGSGATAMQLAEFNNMNLRALEAQLSRDDRFVKDVVERTWLLKAWGIKTIEKMTALDAIEMVLTADGPMAQPELIRRAQAIFPKSYSRYLQVLESEKLGINDRGLWDLASNGSKQIMPKEPKKKKFIRETESQKLIFAVSVTNDMLRGSGFPVDRRITWCAGLVQPTKAKDFVLPEWEGKTLTLTRSPGNSSLSAIRAILETFGLQKNCSVQILLDLKLNRAYLRPHCACHYPRVSE